MIALSHKNGDLTKVIGDISVTSKPVHRGRITPPIRPCVYAYKTEISTKNERQNESRFNSPGIPYHDIEEAKSIQISARTRPLGAFDPNL